MVAWTLYAAAVWTNLPGLWWGLPSHRRLNALGLNVDGHEIREDLQKRMEGPSTPLSLLPDTRGRTIRRMALYTEDPDEITVMAGVIRYGYRGHPGNYQYGGVYLLWLGMVLAGFFSLAFRSREWRLDDPDDVAMAYRVGRVASVLVANLAVPFMYWLLVPRYGVTGAVLGVIVAYLLPWWFFYTRILKPLAFVTPWVVGAVSWREDPLLGGAMAGLAAGSGLPYGIVGVIPALYSGWKAAAVAGVVFAVTNWYMLWGWKVAIRAWRIALRWEASTTGSDWPFTMRLALPLLFPLVAWGIARYPPLAALFVPVGVVGWAMTYVSLTQGRTRWNAGDALRRSLAPGVPVLLPDTPAPFRAPYVNLSRNPLRRWEEGQEGPYLTVGRDTWPTEGYQKGVVWEPWYPWVHAVYPFADPRVIWWERVGDS